MDAVRVGRWSTRIVVTALLIGILAAAAGAESDGITAVSTVGVATAREGRIELARIDGDTWRIALTLNLSPNFFGVVPSLRLETHGANMLPPYALSGEAVSEEGPYFYYEVWRANSFSLQPDYKAVLSFVPSTGLTSVSFGPEGGDPFVERHLYLDSAQVAGDVKVAPEPGDATPSLLRRHEVRILDEAVRLGRPAGLSDRVAMRVAAADDPEPFNWVARQEERTADASSPVRVAVRGIEHALPGALEVAVEEDGERRILWTGPVAGDVDAVLSEHGLAAGRHTLVLSYVDGPYRLALAEAALNVRQAFVWARAYITRYLPGQDAAQADIHVFASEAVAGLDLAFTVGQAGRRLWSGSVSVPAGGSAVVPVEIPAEGLSRLTMAALNGQLVEFSPAVPVYWSSEGLAGYVAAALATEPFLQLGPGERIDRAQLLAAVRLALRLPYHETVQVASDSTLVRARHIALADVPPGAWHYDHVQAVQQAGLLSANLLEGSRLRGDDEATWADVATVVTRAVELVAGELTRDSAQATPRTAEDYVNKAQAAGWFPPDAAADMPVTWAEFTASLVRALQMQPVAQLLALGSAPVRYVLPGTEAYVPDQPYKSVGTFGLWSKGEDVRAKGWLGNEHHRGLLSFVWWPSGSTQQLYWNAFHPDGSRLILGEVGLSGDVTRRFYTVRDASTARWDVTLREDGRDLPTSIYLSRSFPAVLYVTESQEFTWRIDRGAFSLDRAAYVDGSGAVQVVDLAAGSAHRLAGAELGVPWILLLQEMAQTGELVPIFIRMERRPEAVILQRDGGLVLRFAQPAGAIVTMPLYGIARVRGDELDAWRAELPDEALELAQFWSRAAAAFPVGLAEEYAADESAGYVYVRSAFEYHVMEDDWGTEPLPLAPVPPVVALAEQHGYPVSWQSEVLRSRTATFLGPYAYAEGTEVRYALPIYASIDQVYEPVRVKGDAELEALQAQALSHVTDRWFRWPSPSLDSTLLASHAQVYSIVDDPEARAWYKERIAQSLAEHYDERNLDTVFQPASGQSYVYNKRIWAAGEDFDREYYIGRQLVITSEVAHRVGWDVVRPYWDAIRGLYAYYRIHWDWAWQGSTTFNTGFSFQADGVALAWEGMLGMVRMARMAGDDELLQDALYRTAALGASMYALWELTDWAIQNDHAVMSGGGTDLPTRRRPPGEIITGFLPDTYSEFSGVVTTMATEWGASNWIHDELMGRTRFFNDYHFAEIYTWQMHIVPKLYPVLQDGYNISSHLHVRSILYGEDEGLRADIASVGIGTVQGAPGMSYHRVLLRSLVPQVWVSASTGRVQENVWDGAERRLTTRIDVVRDGPVIYDWAWRAIERVDPDAPQPDPGPRPAAVSVNGEQVEPDLTRGGYWRLEIPAAAGESVLVEVHY